jgi:gluconokinase
MQHAVVVMGVAASGKSAVGAALAEALGVPFVDGDDLHPPGNLRKMMAGVPLGDADRAGWLDALASRVRTAGATGGLLLAASALRRAYRDRLRAAGPVTFVYLRADRDVLAARLAARRGHFFPPALLDSQLAVLEAPGDDPGDPAVVVDAAQPPPEVVAAALRSLGAPAGG